MNITHSGYVAIIGRPNVGKSTLLNSLLGQKLSICSPKPQTTRLSILGIKTLDDRQIIYVDTPGIHRMEKRAMNRMMNRVASASIEDADVIVFLVDATSFRAEDKWVLEKLKKINKPVILALNKIDRMRHKVDILPLIDQLKDQLAFASIIPISALRAENLNTFEEAIATLLPPGPAFFPEEQFTDKSLNFQLAEIIREKIFFATEEELPYVTTIEIEQCEMKDNMLEISAIIWVERRGQKIIVIGKKGQRLKKIGMAAREEIEKKLEQKVFLHLWVKVKENWTDNESVLRKLGYE